MNLIAADFNGISLVLIVFAILIGISKGYIRKHNGPIDVPGTDFDSQESEPGNLYRPKGERKKDREIQLSVKVRETPGTPQEKTPEKENNAMPAVPEEEQETPPSFDIRQAIISNEILRRPEF